MLIGVPRRTRHLVGVALFLLWSAGRVGGEPLGELSAKVVGRPAVGTPLVLELTVTNAGELPLSYWCGGPGGYPPAEWFIAIVEGADGTRRELALSNGQYTEGSGNHKLVEAGESVRLPAAADPLPAGRYTLQEVRGRRHGHFLAAGKVFRTTWPALLLDDPQEFVVEDDASASAGFAADLLRRTRGGEPFARHVATKYQVAAVIEDAVAKLESGDPDTVVNAARTLFDLGELPPGLGTVIGRSMRTQLEPEYPDWNALSYLGSLAERDGSDASLDAVLALLDDPRTLPRSRYGIQHLFNFKQRRAADHLRRLVASKDSGVRFTAAVGLSRYKHNDPVAAIPVFVAAAADPEHDDRSHAFYLLADFADDPRAMAAIEAGKRDADERIRRTAQSVLEGIERERARLESIRR